MKLESAKTSNSQSKLKFEKQLDYVAGKLRNPS